MRPEQIFNEPTHWLLTKMEENMRSNWHHAKNRGKLLSKIVIHLRHCSNDPKDTQGITTPSLDAFESKFNSDVEAIRQVFFSGSKIPCERK